MLYNEPSPLEVKVLSRRFGLPNSASIDTYLATDGYVAFKKALGMKPEEIIEEMKTSNLRGRGGAGFPAGMKWSFVPRNSPKPKYIVVNADESEPGTCKDRLLMEYDPHQLIEGMLIAGLAVDAHAGYIYVRGEYRYLIEILDRAIAEAYDRGYLGKNLQGTNFSFDAYTHTGAGAYECGEESALLESLEGKRGIPRIRPPFPAVGGAFQCPTVLNNVETYSAVPAIIRDGGAAFAALGVPKSGGTKLTCLTGHINKPGVYELPVGFPVDNDQRSGRRHPRRQEAEGIYPRRLVVSGAHGGGVRRPDHGPRRHGEEKNDARLGRRGHYGRRHLHGEGGAAHHALLRTRKLRLVHSVPRGHGVAAQNPSALSRWLRPA